MRAFLSLFAQQIASAVVDAPYSGFLVNQSIEETFEVLQWETERTTVPAGTYSLTMPSGLASNRQSVLFVAADVESSLVVITRDTGDSTDLTLTCTVLAGEPFYAVLHNIKSVSITTTATTSFQSFVAKVTPASTAGTTSPNQGIDPGSLPVGGLIALSGTFAATGPLSGYSEAGILPLPSYLQLCDGSIVTDSESIFFGKYLPDLTGDKTLFGSTSAGTDASSSTSATLLTGFGADWNIFQSIDVAAAYRVKLFMRIK